MRAEPLDILCVAPHPDDAELLCGGLLLKAHRLGSRTGVIDLTRGELGTRGSVALRKRESAAATKLLGLSARENLGLRDGGLINDERLLVALVRALRKYRPKLVLAPHWEDMHPDHEAAGKTIFHAAFLCGVPKFDPKSAGEVASANALPYRPRQILSYNNRYLIHADLIVDVTSVFEQKMELVKCFGSQFGPGAAKKNEPQTRLSHGHFIEWFTGMHAMYGHQSGVKYGEAYCVKGPLRADVVKLFEGN